MLHLLNQHLSARDVRDAPGGVDCCCKGRWVQPHCSGSSFPFCTMAQSEALPGADPGTGEGASRNQVVQRSFFCRDPGGGGVPSRASWTRPLGTSPSSVCRLHSSLLHIPSDAITRHHVITAEVRVSRDASGSGGVGAAGVPDVSVTDASRGGRLSTARLVQLVRSSDASVR